MPIRGHNPHAPNSTIKTGLESNPNYLGNGLVGTGLEYQSSDNPMYDAYYKANPFVGQTYKPTWIDQIFGGIFRTGYDKWQNEMALNAAQYDASIVDLQQQNAYNSETAKVDRMRAAGENPDLLGTGDVSDSAAVAPDVQDAQLPEQDDPLAISASVASGVMGLIPKIMSFATTIQQLKGIRIDNDAKELQFGQNALQAASDFFLRDISENEYRDAFEKNDWKDILDAATSNGKYLSETLFSDPNARKRFKMLYGIHSNSMMAKMQKYKTYGEFEEARKGLLSQRASSFFSDDDETMESLLSSILVPAEQYQKRMNEIYNTRAQLRNPEFEQQVENEGLVLEEMQIQNQQKYEATIDPALQAQAENANNAAQKQQQEIMEATNELFSSIMENLKQYDNWWSKIAMALVGIARAQLLSGMHMQFGRQQHYEVNGDTGVLTESGRSNFGFSF